jgi:putative ATP-dependent endonuclease of OLD family
LRNIDIYPNDLCVFVGENNAGKSNILQALNLVLGESWPTVKSLSENDFFGNNMNNTLLIDIHFKENDKNVERIFFRAGLDDDNLKAELKMNFSGNPTEYYVKKEIREQFGILYIKAIRDLHYHLGQSSWTLMGKIGRLLNEEFYNELSQSDKTEVEKLYSTIKSRLAIHKFKELELELKEALSSQLLRTEQEVSLDFQHFDPLNYYKTLQLIPKELGEIKDINQLGDGMKSMVLVARYSGLMLLLFLVPQLSPSKNRKSIYILNPEEAYTCYLKNYPMRAPKFSTQHIPQSL